MVSQLNLNGDPGKIRTSDTQFRKLLLYPPELRGHGKIFIKKNRNALNTALMECLV